MKLVKKKSDEKKEALSKRGRSSRQKGASFEREIAKRFQERYGIEFVRTPQSGGFAKNRAESEGFKGDIVPVDKNTEVKVHVECKSQKTWALPKWIDQAKGDCPEGKVPIVVFRRFGTPQIYVTLPLEGFFTLSEILEEKK